LADISKVFEVDDIFRFRVDTIRLNPAPICAFS